MHFERFSLVETTKFCRKPWCPSHVCFFVNVPIHSARFPASVLFSKDVYKILVDTNDPYVSLPVS